MGNRLIFGEDEDHGEHAKKEAGRAQKLHPANEEEAFTKIADLDTGVVLVFALPFVMELAHES